MIDYQENIVPALGQNSANVFLYKNSNSKIRILFVGNSIAKHAPKPSIGWTRDCGMAASSAECDYVHLVVKMIMEKYDKNVSYGIAQVAEYARTFTEKTPECDYAAAKDFEADLILMFYGANVPKTYDTEANPEKTFGKAYEDMRNYLTGGKDIPVFHSQGFYLRERLDEEKSMVARKYGDVLINIDDIRSLPESHGRFNHPGDDGMKMLAERFFSAIEGTVKKICESK